MGNTDPEAVRAVQSIQMDRWNAHLRRWDAEVAAAERLSWDAQRIGSEFGRLGLQFAFLLNGGALVALPPLMQWLDTSGRTLVAPDAIWFLVGTLCAAFAVVAAYINFMSVAGAQSAYAIKRARELDAEYAGTGIDGDVQHARAGRIHRAFGHAVTVTLVLAVLSALASYVCFGWGAFEFISLAERGTTCASPPANKKMSSGAAVLRNDCGWSPDGPHDGQHA